MDLSIIVPTYNRNNHVVECAAALSHNEAEIIVVDDCSREPVVIPSNVGRVIRHERHCGRAAAINSGLSEAVNDLVLILEEDVYAAPDMVLRLRDEFSFQKKPRLGLTARVVWDPDVPMTLTMKWMESVHKFRSPILLWRPFILEHGGYDEKLIYRLEDVELKTRLEPQGFEVCMVDSAFGFRNNIVKIRDLVEREFLEGVSAVYLHSKFPACFPEIDDFDALARNQNQARSAEAAVEEIALLEQSPSSSLPSGASELYSQICRHYFLHGAYEGLKDVGGIKPRRRNSTTLAIYHQASRLESMGEFDEARRLFKLVLHRPEEEYFDGAEYHLGCIETELGNPLSAHAHFIECMRRNPGHSKARRALNAPTLYREIAPNVFENVDPAILPRVLFIVFGDLAHVVNAFPVVASLRERLGETTWLTLPEYAPLARASFADSVREAEPRGIIPWDWIHAEGFTHVFFPEPGANWEEWDNSELHAIDFMAQKCKTQIETHRSWLEPNSQARSEAEAFLRHHHLKPGSFLTASHNNASNRHWPNSNLMKLAKQTGIPTIVFKAKTDPDIPGTISCPERPAQVIASLIASSSYYLGPDSGISWLATTTNTPMMVFLDPYRQTHASSGFRQVLRGEKNDIEEWDIYTSLQTVMGHIESKLVVGTGA